MPVQPQPAARLNDTPIPLFSFKKWPVEDIRNVCCTLQSHLVYGDTCFIKHQILHPLSL